MTESEMIELIRQRQDLSLDQQAAVLGICRSRVVALRQKAGLNGVRRAAQTKTETQKRRIVQILGMDGPQSAKMLTDTLGLPGSTVSYYLNKLKKDGVIQYAAKIDGGSGRWSLCAGVLARADQLRAPRCMHSMPLNRLPEYFGRQSVVVDQ